MKKAIHSPSDDRRLAAIVFSDIQDFTGKMSRNEDLMMSRLAVHNQVFESLTGRYGGRIVKSTGDGFLVEFPSATQAVKCCLGIQKAFAEAARDLTQSDDIKVRIGIHLCEVIDRDNDIFGAGINIASRLEGQAEPGGICISREVLNSVRSSLKLKTHPIGQVELKHVPEPVEIFKIEPDWISHEYPSDEDIGQVHKTEEYPADKKPRESELHAKQLNRIVVLPFKVISTESDDTHMGEGFAEALIFSLTREKQLIVHPLESTLALSSSPVSLQKVASSLGADYAVRGVIQRSGSKLIVQVSLIRLHDSKTIYSEELKTSAEGLFQDQTKVAKAILFNIVVRLSDGVHASLTASLPDNPQASSFFLKGSFQLRNAITWDDIRQAISLFQKAVMLDKNFALARATLANCYATIYGQWFNDKAWLDKAQSEADIAVSIDPDLPEVFTVLGKVYLLKGNLDEAELHLMNAIRLRHESTTSRQLLAELYQRQGKILEAQALLDEALEINQETGDKYNLINILINLGKVGVLRGNYLKALERYNNAMQLAREMNNQHLEAGIRLNLGAAYKNMGKISLAVENYEQCCATMRRLGDKKYLAVALNNLAFAQEAIGRLDVALKQYQESLRLSQEIGDQQTIAAVLTGIGQIYGVRGEMDPAIENLKQAGEIRRQLGDRMREAKSLINLAAVYCDAGRHDQALRTYTDAHTLVTDTGNRPMLATVLLNIGEIHELGEDFETALGYYDQAESLFNQMESSQYTPYLYLFRGRTFYRMGELGKALVDINLGLAEGEIRATVGLRLDLYNAICRSLLGEEDNWMDKMERAVAALENIGSKPELVEAYRSLSSWLINADHIEEARDMLVKGKTIAEASGMQWEAGTMSRLLVMCLPKT